MEKRFGGQRQGGFRKDFGPREMHKAVCDKCKKECEVPFKPTEGKPVYCKDCYKKIKGF
jgi:CxxC-x17-CxxC domain-containing protein